MTGGIADSCADEALGADARCGKNGESEKRIDDLDGIAELAVGEIFGVEGVFPRVLRSGG